LNLPNQLNFISKNYRPKCDICNCLCEIEWYTQKLKENEQENYYSHSQIGYGHINGKQHTPTKGLLICNKCYENENLPKDLSKADFEFSNFFNIVNHSNTAGNQSN